jgi:hypothetical protein
LEILKEVMLFNIIHFFWSLQKSKKDAMNFDAEFTKEEPVLTPVNADVVRAINQEEFKGFSFVNPDYNPGRYQADKPTA